MVKGGNGKRSPATQAWASFGSDERRELRRQLIERDGTKCHHCSKPMRLATGKFLPDDMTIDHFPVPKRLLPKHQWLDPSRAVLACRECNDGRNREEQQASRKMLNV